MNEEFSKQFPSLVGKEVNGFIVFRGTRPSDEVKQYLETDVQLHTIDKGIHSKIVTEEVAEALKSSNNEWKTKVREATIESIKESRKRCDCNKNKSCDVCSALNNLIGILGMPYIEEKEFNESS